jgi:hypothetical protein
MKNIQNQQLLALRNASLQGGNKALGIVGAVNQYGNEAIGKVDATSAGMRVSNEGKLMAVNNNIAGWKSRLFDSNVRQKWLRQYNQMMNQEGAGNANIVAGIDKIGAAAGGYAAMGGFGRTGTPQIGNGGYVYARDDDYTN